jgi:hypothetical protein
VYNDARAAYRWVTATKGIAPDDTPMEYRWRKTKKRATHHKSFQEFAALTVSVDKALAYFATHAETV